MTIRLELGECRVRGFSEFRYKEQKALVNICKSTAFIVKASKYSATSLMYCHCASDGDFNPLHQI